MRQLTDHIVDGDSVNHQLTIEVQDAPGAGGACHVYEIWLPATDKAPANSYLLRFQNGPIKEAGVNGITHEALTAINIDRMRSFQAGPYACADNQEALEHFEAALECLQRRTRERIRRGVEGTHEK